MEDVTKRVIERLSDADGEHLKKGVELAVDHALSQRVRDVIDPDVTVELLVQLIDDDNVVRFNERHFNPGRKRLIEHFRTTGETPSDLLPDDTLTRLESILRDADYPRAGWASGAITRDQVRSLLAPVIQEVLLAFTRKLPIPGQSGSGDSGGSSRKRRGFGLGSSIMDIGKGVLGDLQERFQDVAREFSSQAINDARQAALDQIASDSGQQTLRDMRDSLVQRFMETKVVEMLDDGERLPIENLLDLVPSIAEHNRVREQFQTFIRGEVEAVIAVEGERTFHELLEENGLHTIVRDFIVSEATRQASDLFATDKAKKWVQALLAE